MNYIEEHLLEIGIPPHQKGFAYTATALELVIDEHSYVNNITKALYPTVAAFHDTTPSRVERAIRHGIETAWKRGNVELLNKMFKYSIDPIKGKPTNGEFLATMALQMRDEAKEAHA